MRNPLSIVIFSIVLSFAIFGCFGPAVGTTTELSTSQEGFELVQPGSKVEKLAGGFEFTEGPAVCPEGNVFFTDIPNNRIHKWSISGELSIFKEDSGAANGLYFDGSCNLLACEGGRRQLVSISPAGEVTVLVDSYEGKRLNSHNDLWPDPKGGIYFTDPRYGNRDNLEQDGEHVYYLKPGRQELVRVIDDMVRPNGIIGTPDGSLLYVTDHGDGKTYVYSVEPGGTLTDKKLIAPEGSDGMTLDEQGNLYLTNDAVVVYSPQGQRLGSIEVPERPANVSFGGKTRDILFITARTSLYSVQMNVKGAK
ncbi:MAG: SMP-30/gluconolactonase/LRE family protein [Acidobacteriota bacterium]|nr:MAG: SMP-30/gluconolactonase/LRE family protein [Acidobacteriota bacterium]